MSKLTNAEKDKLDNTCGNLRVTKLGTHVKTLEDFVNEGVLDTRANTVVEAINELYGMIVNKDCEGITIPPPGFFTLFGNDEDGKLYVYYNNADYPPQFRHVETPGELEGTLYLYIADPLGENHYELEVGHYIAVRHLDNYYTKAQINSMFTVTVEKQTTAESGSFATYVVKQGGTQVGPKINIPKDYLVKSCSVKSCTTANVPVQGYKVGDKYIDWVINTRDGSATNEHLYLLVNEIVEPYKADNSTVTLSSGNVFSVKDGGITLVKLAPAVQNLINGKADANHTHGNITKEGKVGTTQNVPLITGTGGVVQAGSFGSGANNFARGNHGHSDLASIAYVDNQIASVEGDVVIDLESKADKNHEHSYGVLESGNIDNIINDYCYGISKAKINDGSITGNMPPTDRTSGVRSFLLESRKYDDNSSIQFAYILSTTENYNRVFYRSRTGGAWDTWREIVQISDIDNINTALDGKANTSHTHTKSQITDFPTTMTPTSHSHGNISNAGAVGTAANKPLITGNNGVISAGSFGTSANTFAQGNHEHSYGVLESGNIDNIINDYCYGISKAKINDGSITGNMPPTDRTSGVRSFLLESRKYDDNSSIQFAYILSTTENYNRVFYRSRTGGAWDTWREIVQISDIDSINTALGGKANSNHTHGNLQNNGQVGSTVQASKNVVTDANGKITTENKPSIPTKTSQLTNDGDGTNVFVKNNDSRITNAVSSACKIGFSNSGTTPATSLEFSVSSGTNLYAIIRDANGNIPTNITKGYMVVNGSFQSKTVHSETGTIYAQMNVKATFLVEAGFFDANGWIVCSATCKVTVS